MANVRAWLIRRRAYLGAILAGLLILLAAEVPVTVSLLVGAVLLLPVIASQPGSPVPSVERPASRSAELADPLREVKSAFADFESPVYLLDSNGNVLYGNRAARDAFGEILPGLHVTARIRLPVVVEMIRETLATGLPGQAEYSGVLSSESVYQVRMVSAGEAVAPFFVLIFRDITESRRIDRMRSDFVANASHELRTPLASLRGFIETLLGPAKADPVAQVRFLNIMLEQVTRMSRLVDDLLSLSRLELKARLSPDDEVDLGPLIGSVCDALAPLASQVGVEIRRRLPEQPVMVRGDRDELTQVFENLIENACKYGQEGKFVDVELVKAENHPVEARITDYGPGIDKDSVPRLTERFYRVNVESSVSKKGTGLGLAIVKHILTRHRARLVIQSEKGKGSTFTVRF